MVQGSFSSSSSRTGEDLRKDSWRAYVPVFDLCCCIKSNDFFLVFSIE